MIEIPTINRTKKTPKPRYQKPASVKQLVPVQCRFKKAFRDDTANGLAGCVEAWCKVHGAFFQRMNSQGQYDGRLKMWRKSGTTKGIADVQVTYKGRTYNLEIKVERKIKAAGGHYAIIHCYDDFLRQINIFH